jgi:hypothetical protein
MVPDDVTTDVTLTFLMRIAMASPGTAPATATGLVTSCPPLKEGVIIGPQHPGAVSAVIVPPLATGPTMGMLGPTKPPVNVFTRIVFGIFITVPPSFSQVG